MKAILIAQVAHAINLAYCASLGDFSLAPWEAADEAQHKSMLAGVEVHLANPDLTPEQSHEAWLAHKVEQGWVYGDVKDLDAKVHPNIRPYAELSPEQKAKDHIFRAVVHALKDIPDSEDAYAAVELEVRELRQKLEAAQRIAITAGPARDVLVIGGQGVKYIGIKPDFKDHLYGTGLVFVQQQVRVVPAHVARSFLRHADLFEAADVTADAPVDDTAQTLADVEAQNREKAQRELDLQALHQSLDQITDKATLTEFGARYGVKINKNANAAQVDKAKAEIHAKIDQFGVV